MSQSTIFRTSAGMNDRSLTIVLSMGIYIVYLTEGNNVAAIGFEL